MKSEHALHGDYHLPPHDFQDLYQKILLLHQQVNTALGIVNG
jgi:hypothetical protein